MYFVVALVNAILTFKIREIEKKFRDKEEKENIKAALVEFFHGKVTLTDQGLREVEVPVNLDNNLQNQIFADGTLGDLRNHIKTLTQNSLEFAGDFPGVSNLRDLGNITVYGTKFVQHSGPASLSLYHITSADNNIVRAIEHARPIVAVSTTGPSAFIDERGSITFKSNKFEQSASTKLVGLSNSTTLADTLPWEWIVMVLSFLPLAIRQRTR